MLLFPHGCLFEWWWADWRFVNRSMTIFLFAPTLREPLLYPQGLGLATLLGRVRKGPCEQSWFRPSSTESLVIAITCAKALARRYNYCTSICTWLSMHHSINSVTCCMTIKGVLTDDQRWAFPLPFDFVARNQQTLHCEIIYDNKVERQGQCSTLIVTLCHCVFYFWVLSLCFRLYHRVGLANPYRLRSPHRDCSFKTKRASSTVLRTFCTQLGKCVRERNGGAAAHVTDILTYRLTQQEKDMTCVWQTGLAFRAEQEPLMCHHMLLKTGLEKCGPVLIHSPS